jgi:TnpA family transposase
LVLFVSLYSKLAKVWHTMFVFYVLCCFHAGWAAEALIDVLIAMAMEVMEVQYQHEWRLRYSIVLAWDQQSYKVLKTLWTTSNVSKPNHAVRLSTHVGGMQYSIFLSHIYTDRPPALVIERKENTLLTKAHSQKISSLYKRGSKSVYVCTWARSQEKYEWEPLTGGVHDSESGEH